MRVAAKSKVRQGWFEVPHAHIAILRRCVTATNNIRGKAEQIPGFAQGDHQLGHLAISECYRELKMVMETKLGDNTSFKDCLEGKYSDLNYAGYRLFYAGYPIPHVLFSRGEQTPSGFLLLEKLGGSEKAFNNPSAATPRLLLDDSGRYAIDGRSLGDELKQWPAKLKSQWWHAYQLGDEFSAIEFRKHYYFEKNNLSEAAAIIQAMGLSEILLLFKLKNYCEFLCYPLSDKRFVTNPWVRNRAVELAFEQDVPHDLLTRQPKAISMAAYRQAEVLISAVEIPLESFLEGKTAEPVGGLLPQRSRLSYLLGLLPQTTLPEVPPELEELNKQAGQIREEVYALLRNDEPEVGAKRKRRLPHINVADLDHPKPFFRQLAMVEIQKIVYPEFMEQSGLAQLYEDLGKECLCPMPFSGFGQVGLRLKAAVTAKTQRDLGGQHYLPEHFFQPYEPPSSLSEPTANAFKAIHRNLALHCNRFMEMIQLHHKYPMVESIFDHWTCFGESRFRFMGHGVDSVEKLVPAVFFFSARYFRSLLKGEEQSFVEKWLKIRIIIETMIPDIRGQKYREIAAKLQKIFAEMQELHLQTVALDPENPSNPGPASHTDIFNPPPDVMGEGDWINEEDASAPIYLAMAPPGNAARYQEMIASNLPYINMLKQLDSRPLKEVAQMQGYAKAGPLFDPLRQHLFQLGHCIFGSVKYPLEPVAGKRYLVYIIFDFSGSMNKQRVLSAKNIAVMLAEGLKDRFDVVLSIYNTESDFYRIMQMFDSRQRSGLGEAGLSSLCREGLESGSGWNPDAAALLALLTQFRRQSLDQVIVIHLSDHEYCKSLSKANLRNAQEEVHYAVNKLLTDGHAYIAARVGTDQDPFGDTEIAHEYIHFPAIITTEKVKELYHTLCRTTLSLVN